MAYRFINEKPVKFKKWICNVQKMKYGNNRVALMLIEQGTYEPIATATVNLPDEQLLSDEIFIKDWSENEGMLDALKKSGLIGDPIGKVKTGFVKAHKCKLLVDL